MVDMDKNIVTVVAESENQGTVPFTLSVTEKPTNESKSSEIESLIKDDTKSDSEPSVPKVPADSSGNGDIITTTAQAQELSEESADSTLKQIGNPNEIQTVTTTSDNQCTTTADHSESSDVITISEKNDLNVTDTTPGAFFTITRVSGDSINIPVRCNKNAKLSLLSDRAISIQEAQSMTAFFMKQEFKENSMRYYPNRCFVLCNNNVEDDENFGKPLPNQFEEEENETIIPNQVDTQSQTSKKTLQEYINWNNDSESLNSTDNSNQMTSLLLVIDTTYAEDFAKSQMNQMKSNIDTSIRSIDATVINKRMVQELKCLGKPPQGCSDVLQCVQTLLTGRYDRNWNWQKGQDFLKNSLIFMKQIEEFSSSLSESLSVFEFSETVDNDNQEKHGTKSALTVLQSDVTLANQSHSDSVQSDMISRFYNNWTLFLQKLKLSLNRYHANNLSDNNSKTQSSQSFSQTNFTKSLLFEKSSVILECRRLLGRWTIDDMRRKSLAASGLIAWCFGILKFLELIQDAVETMGIELETKPSDSNTTVTKNSNINVTSTVTVAKAKASTTGSNQQVQGTVSKYASIVADHKAQGKAQYNTTRKSLNSNVRKSSSSSVTKTGSNNNQLVKMSLMKPVLQSTVKPQATAAAVTPIKKAASAAASAPKPQASQTQNNTGATSSLSTTTSKRNGPPPPARVTGQITKSKSPTQTSNKVPIKSVLSENRRKNGPQTSSNSTKADITVTSSSSSSSSIQTSSVTQSQTVTSTSSKSKSIITKPTTTISTSAVNLTNLTRGTRSSLGRITNVSAAAARAAPSVRQKLFKPPSRVVLNSQSQSQGIQGIAVPSKSSSPGSLGPVIKTPTTVGAKQEDTGAKQEEDPVKPKSNDIDDNNLNNLNSESVSVSVNENFSQTSNSQSQAKDAIQNSQTLKTRESFRKRTSLRKSEQLRRRIVIRLPQSQELPNTSTSQSIQTQQQSNPSQSNDISTVTVEASEKYSSLTSRLRREFAPIEVCFVESAMKNQSIEILVGNSKMKSSDLRWITSGKIGDMLKMSFITDLVTKITKTGVLAKS